MTGRILLVEDNEKLARTYRGFLRDTDFEVITALTGQAARVQLRESPPDAILLDVRLPDVDGIEFLREVRAGHHHMPVAVMTAHGTDAMASQALEAGADDFLTKPFAGERLRVTLRNLVAKSRAERELAAIQDALGQDQFEGMIGASSAMQAVYQIIRHSACSKATVFITGESGTGKELAAEAIHKRSQRAAMPFIALNCGAIPADLMESEIFGHIKGAFTGAFQDRLGAARSADGGTLFLDEIGELDLNLQTKLLRFLQTGQVTPVGTQEPVPVDVRILCATNRDPMAEVRAKRFREDLYYRLHVVPLHLPPLREREGDVILIAEQLFTLFAQQEGKVFHGLSDEAKVRLTAHRWPGNVRELENIVRKTVVMTSGGTIEASMLDLADNADKEVVAVQEAGREITMRDLASRIKPLAQVERETIEHALELCSGDVRKAAVFLDISPATIYRKQKKWS